MTRERTGRGSGELVQKLGKRGKKGVGRHAPGDRKKVCTRKSTDWGEKTNVHGGRFDPVVKSTDGVGGERRRELTQRQKAPRPAMPFAPLEPSLAP